MTILKEISGNLGHDKIAKFAISTIVVRQIRAADSGLFRSTLLCWLSEMQT